MPKKSAKAEDMDGNRQTNAPIGIKKYPGVLWSALFILWKFCTMSRPEPQPSASGQFQREWAVVDNALSFAARTWGQDSEGLSARHHKQISQMPPSN